MCNQSYQNFQVKKINKNNSVIRVNDKYRRNFKDGS